MRAELIVGITLVLVLQVFGASDKVVVGYFAEWATDKLPARKVSYSKLTHINYAFATFTDKDYIPRVENEETLTEVVKLAKYKDTKVLVSIGGWEGSKYFSKMVASAYNRSRFIKGCVNLVKRFDLDGIDLDWEYPGREGAAGNIVSDNDSKKYLQLLEELRDAIPKKLLTAAVRVEPFDGPNGPLTDVQPFAQIFDFLNLMTYDINGPWSKTTGPVCGLDFEDGKGEQNSVKQAINSWSKAGFPKSKLVVGIPFYGYAEGVNVDMTRTDQYQKVVDETLPSYAYNDLYNKNVLIAPKLANKKKGWTRNFDPITKTPWLFNSKTKTFIGYEDVQSIQVKTDFVSCNDYRGVMLWALDNDYQDQLLDALQNVHSKNNCPTESSFLGLNMGSILDIPANILDL